jgi:hypothetical protein
MPEKEFGQVNQISGKRISGWVGAWVNNTTIRVYQVPKS